MSQIHTLVSQKRTTGTSAGSALSLHGRPGEANELVLSPTVSSRMTGGMVCVNRVCPSLALSCGVVLLVAAASCSSGELSTPQAPPGAGRPGAQVAVAPRGVCDERFAASAAGNWRYRTTLDGARVIVRTFGSGPHVIVQSLREGRLETVHVVPNGGAVYFPPNWDSLRTLGITQLRPSVAGARAAGQTPRGRAILALVERARASCGSSS
jgi:hypothetical protein